MRGTSVRSQSDTQARASWSIEQLRSAVAAVADLSSDELEADTDLLQAGLDSLRVMRLANQFRRAGFEITFGELIEVPTLAAWSARLTGTTAAPGSATGGPVPEPAPGPPADPAEPFELAPMQQAYWIGRADDQVLGGVDAHYYAELDGAGVDPGRLESAIGSLLHRHGMLRARFLPEGRQRVADSSPWAGVTVHDLRATDPHHRDEYLTQLRSRLSARRLAVEAGELFDVQLSLLPGERTRLHLNIAMLVADATSFQVLLEELAAFYVAPARRLPALALTFADYLAAQSQRRGPAHEQAREYWRSRIADLPGPPGLPLAVDPAKLGAHGAARRSSRLSGAERDRLARRARAHGLTLPVVFATAFAETLAGWSAEPRFILSLPVFDREELHPDVPRLVGDFTNLLVLAVDLSGPAGFAERAHAVQESLHAGLAHAHYSGLEVLRDVARHRPGEQVAAPVVFTSAIGLGDLFGPEVRACFGAPVWTSSQTPQVSLDQQVTDREGSLLINWDVVEELFPPGLVDALFDRYREILDWLGADSADWSRPPPAGLPAGQATVRAAANDTAGPLPNGLLQDAFFALAERDPERTALVDTDGSSVSYGRLADRARRIAGRLAGQGVGAGDLVAVTLPRGAAQIAAVLGVLYAGAGYVPIGIGQPARRRAAIQRRAGVRAVLCADPADSAGVDVPVFSVEAVTGAEPLGSPVRCSADDLAYVIYTSGSTGEPKGVEITHRAALNTVSDVTERFAIGPDDAVLAVSALDFDLSVYDLFGLLGCGGRVVLVDEDARREGRELARLVRAHGVTLWNSVPGLLDLLLVGAGGRPLPGLRTALVSGDWVPLELRARLSALAPACRLIALGGATEAAIWSNFCVVDVVPPHWRSVPYGRPLRNQSYRVVDARGQDAPDWVAGELWIGGAGVARGYRGDPMLTAERFVQRDGVRWYRTGDRGRYWPDGTLEFLGRTDNQVKIRGHRIELGEIEAAAESHPGVLAAVAVVLTGPGDGATAAKSLGLLVGAASGPDDSLLRELTAHLTDRLPGYMVPDRVLIRDAVPRTTNGKSDRKAVAALFRQAASWSAGGDEAAVPAPGLERELASVWAPALDLDVERPVARRESFFLLGGDSLLATRLLERVRQRYGIELTLGEFFADPTLAGLAAAIAARSAGDGAGADYEEGAL